MAHKKGQLYNVVLNEYVRCRLHGYTHEVAFIKAKLHLVEYFVDMPNVGKQAFGDFWEDMQHITFSQDISYDFQLRRKAMLDAQLPVS